MSLAVGAGVNITCYLQDLKWVVSAKLKSDLQARFGGSNPRCGDNDRDGYSLIAGDCDDRDAARSPAHEEILGNSQDELVNGQDRRLLPAADQISEYLKHRPIGSFR